MRSDQLRLGLTFGRPRLVECRLGLIESGIGAIELRLVCLHGGGFGFRRFDGSRLVVGKAFRARRLSLRFVELSLDLRDHRMGGRHSRLRLFDFRGGRFHTGPRLVDLAPSRSGRRLLLRDHCFGCSNGRLQRNDVFARLVQLDLTLIHGQLIGTGVDLKKQISLPHELVVRYRDVDQIAAHPRSNLDDVGAYLTVARPGVALVPIVERIAGDQRNDDNGAGDQFRDYLLRDVAS